MSTITVAAALLCLSCALAQAPAGKLVGYWPFEEADGLAVLDASGHGHAGTIANDGRGVKRVPGHTGGGLQFTGGDPAARDAAGAVTLPGFAAQDWSQGLTVELWVLLTTLDRPATYELLSDTKDDRGPGWRFMISWLSLWLRSGEGGAGKTWGAGTSPSAVSLQTGQWYHLAGTYDGSVFRVYVDGALAAQSDAGLALTPGAGTLCLGSYHGGYAYGLNGIVDEVRLYNYARTPAEIMADARLSQ